MVRDENAVGGASRLFVFLGSVAVALAVATAPASAVAEETGPDSTQPLRLIVSLEDQRVNVYRGLELVESSPVSTGKKGHATPRGVYSILQKRRWHRSNIYSRAPMPFMQRLTWSGIALHAGRVPGYPASHGCIRLPKTFAKSLFSKTDIGVDVIVSGGAAKPEHIQHEALFQPAPQPRLSEAFIEARLVANVAASPASFERSDLPTVIDRLRAEEAKSTSPIRILVTRRTGRERMKDVQRLLAELGHDPGEIDGYLGRNTGAAVQAFQKSRDMRPTGMVNDELIAALYEAVDREEISGHLYVRQDYTDLFDMPVHLKDPDQPLGTHVYSAERFGSGSTRIDWTALTIDGADVSTPEQALNRIVIPEKASKRIARMMTPGTSLVITDAGMGRETGKGTDFIVQPR